MNNRKTCSVNEARDKTYEWVYHRDKRRAAELRPDPRDRGREVYLWMNARNVASRQGWDDSATHTPRRADPAMSRAYHDSSISGSETYRGSHLLRRACATFVVHAESL
jgi:hypothetical protein